MGSSFLFLQIFVTLSGGFLIEDPCINPKVLDNGMVRYATNKLDTSLTPAEYLCDDVPDGWYRFLDTEISTTCVDTYHCTKIPIWMNDTVPQVIDGVQRKTFCVNHDTGSTVNRNCCSYTFTSDVKNCGNYMVYNLMKENIQCPMAYCTRAINLCTNKSACTDALTYFSSPKLSGPYSTTSGFKFVCDFNHSNTDSTLMFDVIWKFNDKTVHVENVNSSGKGSSIDHSWWTGHLGEELSCSVRSFIMNGSEKLYSPEKHSNPYMGGIRVSPSNMTLTEGEVAQIKIISTLPILCSRSNCSLNLRLVVDHNDTFQGTDLLFHPCQGVALSSMMFDVKAYSVSTSVDVTMPMNQIIHPDGHHTVRYDVIADSGRHNMWDGHVTKEVVITTRDVPHGQCAQFGNGHIYGFNKSDTEVYLQSHSGDYIMYRAEYGDPSDLEIQNRFHLENKKTASICATAIQYGGVVVFVDMCSKVYTEGAPFVTSTKPSSSMMAVYMCDPSYYLVYTNDDVALEIRIHEKNLEVNLHLPPSYSTDGFGTCSYNSNYQYMAWNIVKPLQLASSESFFAEGKDRFNGVSYAKPETYCQCGTQRCSTNRRITDSITFKRNDCTPITPKSSDIYKDWNVHMKAENSYTGSSTFPSPSGLTESDGFHKCTEVMEKYSPYMCVQDHLFNYRFQQACVYDMGTEDGFDLLKSTLQGFLWACEEMYLKDTMMYLKNVSTGTMQPTPVLSTDLCPDFCNLQGQCQAGQCHCDRHFTGIDCSMTIWAQPQILDIIDGQVCGDSLNECSVPILVTRNIMDGLGLIASVAPYEFATTDGVLKNADSHSLKANWENEYSVSVNLSTFVQPYGDKPIIGFNITLLHNGKVSNSLNYIVADSTCLDCSAKNMSCTIQKDTCFIGDKCFLDGDRKSDDFTKGCDPRQSQHQWIAV